MSEIKDKVVTLEILKVAYDELKEETGQLSEEIDYVKKSSNIVERNAVGTCKIQHGKCIRSYNTETLLPNIIDKTGEMVVEYTLPRMGVIRVPKTGVSYQSFMLLDDNGKHLYNLTETGISNTSDLFPVIEDEYYEFSVDYLFKLGHLYPNPKTILFGFVDNGNAYIKEYNCYDENDVSFIDLSVYAKKDDVINNFEIVTPTDFICTAGLPFNIHIDQILKGVNKNDVDYLQEVENKYGDFYKNEFYANNSPLSGSKTFFLKMKGKYPNKNFTINFIRSGVPTAEKTLNVVFIGDSMTYHGHYIYHLMQKFSDTSITFNSVGTLRRYSHEIAIQCEGRYGWSAYNYCHDASYGDFENAFLDSEGNFNFSNWVRSNNMEIVNCVSICLGTNDLNNYTIEQMIDSMNIMLSSIREYSATIPVLFWLPPTRALADATKSYYIDKDKALTAHQNIISNFCGRTHENVYVVPVYFYVDPYNDYDFKTVDLDGHGLTVAKIANDAVHPNADAGHLHIADAFYSAFCYLLVKNIV